MPGKTICPSARKAVGIKICQTLLEYETLFKDLVNNSIHFSKYRTNPANMYIHKVVD